MRDKHGKLIELAMKNPLQVNTSMQSRLTIFSQITHEVINSQSVTVPISFTKFLKGTEESSSKRFKVGTEWKPLDLLGWDSEDIGLIIIENVTGRNLTVQPTPEEREHLEASTIELRIGCSTENPKILIPYQTGFPLMLSFYSDLSIRSQQPDSYYKLHVITN